MRDHHRDEDSRTREPAVAEWGWVSKNPVRLATRPKKRSKKREPILLCPADVEAIRGSMAPKDAALVSMLAYAGLRPGEALALTWADVDVAKKTISVTKALSVGRVKGTKNGRDRRVPVIAPLRSDLLQWRFASGGGTGDDLVFPNFEGRHWTEPDWRAWAGRRLKPALERAGLPREVRAYDLRHSYISMLIASGLNPVEVAKRAGNSPTMTMDTYAHVFEQWEGKRINLEEEIRRARGDLQDDRLAAT